MDETIEAKVRGEKERKRGRLVGARGSCCVGMRGVKDVLFL